DLGARDRQLPHRQLRAGLRRRAGRLSHPHPGERARAQGHRRLGARSATAPRARRRRAGVRRRGARERQVARGGRRSRPERRRARGGSAVIALVAAALYTSTTHVRAVALAGNILWAATSGGVEQYDLTSRTRTRLFTTADGLD